MSGHEDAGLVLEQINLLERTSPLLVSEAAFSDRLSSGLGCSVLKTLLYLTQHYYAAPENLLHSPAALVKMHRQGNMFKMFFVVVENFAFFCA